MKARILVIVMFLLVISSFAFGIDTSNNLVWYNMDNSSTTYIDESNQLNATAYNGVIFLNDSLSKYSDYEGINDYGATTSLFPSTDSNFTMACWVNSDETTRGDYFGQSGFAKLSVGLTTNYYGAVVNFDSDGIVLQSTTTIDTNNFIHTALTYDKDTKTGKLFIDGTEEDSYTSTGTKSTNSNVLFLGAEVESVGGTIFNPYDGALSGCIVYNDTLSPTEISQLYAEDRDYSPYGVSANFTIQARDSTTLTNIQTFNATVNGTFYNTTIGLITLPYLLNNSGILNITVEADNYFSYSNETYNSSNPLVADLDPELLQDFNLTTPNNTKTNESYYNVTYTEAVSPTNKTVTYNISVLYLNGTLKESFTTTNLIYELNLTDYNANIYNISVNAEENVTGLNFTHYSNLYVDRTNYIYFQDGNDLTALTSKNITLTLPNQTEESYTTDAEGRINFQSFRNLAFQNGTYNITYEGDQGYVTPITFEYTPATLPFNITYNISRANLTINIKDLDTGSLVTENVTISITMIGTFTEIDGILNLENQTFVSGDYTVYVSSENYTYNQKTFTFTNQEVLELDLFIIKKTTTNLGTIFVNVYDSYLDVVAGADLRLQELDPATSSFVEVGQRLSSSSGGSAFNVLLDEKSYRIYATYTVDGITYEGYSIEEGEIFYADGQVVPIYLNTIVGADLSEYEGLSVTVTNKNLTNNISTHSVTFIDTNGLSHEVCLLYSYLNGVIKTTLEEICIVGSSGTINYDGGYLLDRNYTNIVDVYVKEGTYKRYYYTQTYSKDNSFESLFAELIKPLIAVLTLISLAVALYINRIDLFIYLGILLSVLWGILAPSYMSGTTIGLNIILGLAVLYLARKRNNSQDE